MKNDHDKTPADSHDLSVRYFRQMLGKINCDVVTRIQILLNVYGTGRSPNNLRFLRNTVYRWLLPYALKRDTVVVERCLEQIRRFEQAVGHEAISKDHPAWNLIKKN